jgi:hypothetical protein
MEQNKDTQIHMFLFQATNVDTEKKNRPPEEWRKQFEGLAPDLPSLEVQLKVCARENRESCEICVGEGAA